MKVKVAAVQMNSTDSVEHNMAQAGELVREAAAQGCQLVLLPEYFCYMGPTDAHRLSLAEAFGKGPIQSELSALAKECGIWLSAGTVPLEAGIVGKVFNSNLLFDPEGKCADRYDKVHLFGFDNGEESYRESDTLQPGTEIKTFTLPFGRLRPSVCYDLRFPELYRKECGYEIITAPAAFTYTTGKAHWEVLLRTRAIENQCFVIAAGQSGMNPSGKQTFGHSMIIDPWGTVLAQKPDGVGIVVAEIDMERLREYRQQLPALDNRVYQ